MPINKKSKHYLLAKGCIKQDQKEYGIPKEDMPLLIKKLARQILSSMNRNEFILVKVKIDKPKKK